MWKTNQPKSGGLLSKSHEDQNLVSSIRLQMGFRLRLIRPLQQPTNQPNHNQGAVRF